MSSGTEKGQHGGGSVTGRVPSLYVPSGPLGEVATPGSRASSRSVAPGMLDRRWCALPPRRQPPSSTEAPQVGRQPWPWLSGHPGRQGAGAAG